MRRRGVGPMAVALAAVAVLAALLAACSGDDDDGGGATASTTTAGGNDAATSSTATTVPAVQRPDGPAADTSEVLTGGNGMFVASPRPSALPATGWVEEERVAAGTATSYTSAGDLPTDGRFELTEDATADYRTRIVVRRPESPADFSGTVVVEWLNVSGGLDADPDFAMLATELVRNGDAWVGVSAQRIGIEGGPVAVSVAAGEGIAGVGLRNLDPARYGSLHHPGDAFAYDIYTQVARAVRAGDVLGDLEPARVLAVGESQSAFALTTYADGVQPLTHEFDGFLIHSRGGAPAPLSPADPAGAIDIASSIGGQPTIIRTDLDVPVLVVETETDVLSILGYYPARQDDTDRFRLWEIAGTAHADRFLIGDAAGSLDCGGDLNAGPQRFVVRAALRALDRWVATGEAPPTADRLDVDASATPAYRRDADGIVLGGIRTPEVDAPVDVLSGDPWPSDQVVCLLLGSTKPLPPARLAERYGGAEAYLEAYRDALDAAVDAGFVLDADRDEILADAHPDRLGG